MPAIKYTTNYSAIVKLARVLVIEHVYQSRSRQIAAARVLGYNESRAREDSETYFKLVRKIVDRFIELEGSQRGPTPMDWIISKRAYRINIRFDTTAEGTV